MPKLKVSKPPDVELFDNDIPEAVSGFDLSKIVVMVLLVLVLLLGYFVFKLYQNMTKSSEEVVLLKTVIGKQMEMLSGLNKPYIPPEQMEELKKEVVETATKEVPHDNTLETVVEEVTDFEAHSNLDEIDETEN